MDDDEINWSCEDCAPRMDEPAPAFRKSQRNYSRVDREALRRKSRKNRRYNLSMSKVEQSNCVGKGANKTANDASTLDEKKKVFVESKQGKLKKDRSASKMGGSEPAPLLRQNKKVLNSDDDVKKDSSGQKIKDLYSMCVDGEDLQKDLKKNSGPPLSKESNHSLERTCKVDEISLDSVAENCHKRVQSSSGTHSSILEDQQRIGNSQATNQPDGAEEKTSDNIEETKASSVSHQRGDKKSGYNICEYQTRKKKRKFVIAMEYSDSDEEPVVRTKHPQIIPDVGDVFIHMRDEPHVMTTGDHDLVQRRFMKSDDHSPIQSYANHTIGFDNRVISPHPYLMSDKQVPVQPIMNAVWRGCCTISDDDCSLSFKLEAHLSNKAHEKVSGAASALPNSLCFEIWQKDDAWPNSFEKSPPTSETIGLYFFPVDERDEKRYEILLDEMIEDEIVLKSRINNLELLVFCSLELPREDRRFRGKYFLWGVFKQKQEMPLTSRPPIMYHNKDLGIAGEGGAQRLLQL
ncbi:hypothetical protein SOVF_007740 [Spinacia oleracea]|nr:hypothetical protein SOVF_007740 [Spinacia oleracea]